MLQCKLIIFSNFYCILSCCLNLFFMSNMLFCMYILFIMHICIPLCIHVTVLYTSCTIFWLLFKKIMLMLIIMLMFSLFTFHLENSTVYAYVKPSLENNSSNLLISIAVVIKITVIYTQ